MRGQRFLMVLGLSLGLRSIAAGADYYVSPTGSGVVGSFAAPMGLSNALKSGVSPATGGDTIWLRGGTYQGTFGCNLSAASNSPIVIKNYNGERAIIDSHNQFAVNGGGTWFWGLEFTDTFTNRYTARTSGLGLNTGPTGMGNKLINCILHDLGNAIFVSSQSTNAEVTGCVIYNIGYSNTTWSGHCLYVQNHSYANQSHYRENILFNGFSVGINVRASSANVNHRFTGNVVFNTAKNFYAESYPADQLFLDSNMFYYSVENEGGHFYGWESTNGTIVLSNNVFANNFCNFVNWTNIIYNNNRQHRKLYARGMETNSVRADYNRYYNVLSAAPVAFNDVGVTLTQWQDNFGNDVQGTATAAAPSGTWTYVRPNPYEAGRANITVYNWDTNNMVSVDVSGVLTSGQRYQVRNAADYFGPLAASGTYSGGSLTLPMTNLSVVTPVGLAAQPATGPRFNVFVLLPQPPLLPPSNLKPL
jgi:hypothetical protein